MNNIKWIDCNDRLPPKPETPYHVYPVWAVQRLSNATGTKHILQWDGRNMCWMPLREGFLGVAYGEECVVTHWSEVLDILGCPDPQPYGPRGTDVWSK